MKLFASTDVGYRPPATLAEAIAPFAHQLILGAITAVIGLFGVWFVIDYNSAATQYGMCVSNAVAQAAEQDVPVDEILSGRGCGEAPAR
jgi:hypothetical protein